jgi:hypothetical protein
VGQIGPFLTSSNASTVPGCRAQVYEWRLVPLLTLVSIRKTAEYLDHHAEILVGRAVRNLYVAELAAQS